MEYVRLQKYTVGTVVHSRWGVSFRNGCLNIHRGAQNIIIIRHFLIHDIQQYAYGYFCCNICPKVRTVKKMHIRPAQLSAVWVLATTQKMGGNCYGRKLYSDFPCLPILVGKKKKEEEAKKVFLEAARELTFPSTVILSIVKYLPNKKSWHIFKFL